MMSFVIFMYAISPAWKSISNNKICCFLHIQQHHRLINNKKVRIHFRVMCRIDVPHRTWCCRIWKTNDRLRYHGPLNAKTRTNTDTHWAPTRVHTRYNVCLRSALHAWNITGSRTHAIVTWVNLNEARDWNSRPIERIHPCSGSGYAIKCSVAWHMWKWRELSIDRVL